MCSESPAVESCNKAGLNAPLGCKEIRHPVGFPVREGEGR